MNFSKAAPAREASSSKVHLRSHIKGVESKAKALTFEEWAKNERVNLKDPSVIPQVYPKYIDYWKRVYGGVADSPEALEQFSRDNHKIITDYYNYQIAYWPNHPELKREESTQSLLFYL